LKLQTVAAVHVYRTLQMYIVTHTLFMKPGNNQLDMSEMTHLLVKAVSFRSP